MSSSFNDPGGVSPGTSMAVDGGVRPQPADPGAVQVARDGTVFLNDRRLFGLVDVSEPLATDLPIPEINIGDEFQVLDISDEEPRQCTVIFMGNAEVSTGHWAPFFTTHYFRSRNDVFEVSDDDDDADNGDAGGVSSLAPSRGPDLSVNNSDAPYHIRSEDNESSRDVDEFLSGPAYREATAPQQHVTWRTPALERAAGSIPQGRGEVRRAWS